MTHSATKKPKSKTQHYYNYNTRTTPSTVYLWCRLSDLHSARLHCIHSRSQYIAARTRL